MQLTTRLLKERLPTLLTSQLPNPEQKDVRNTNFFPVYQDYKKTKMASSAARKTAKDEKNLLLISVNAEWAEKPEFSPSCIRNKKNKRNIK